MSSEHSTEQFVDNFSLKRTNSVLQEHEEALQKKKENSFAKVHQSRQALS